MDDFHGMKITSSERHNEEIIRLLNEILAEMKENTTELKSHNRVVASLDEKVRKISINTSGL